MNKQLNNEKDKFYVIEKFIKDVTNANATLRGMIHLSLARLDAQVSRELINSFLRMDTDIQELAEQYTTTRKSLMKAKDALEENSSTEQHFTDDDRNKKMEKFSNKLSNMIVELDLEFEELFGYELRHISSVTVRMSRLLQRCIGDAKFKKEFESDWKTSFYSTPWDLN